MALILKPTRGQGTAFFRNRAFIAELLSLLPKDRSARVLCHACSIGAEPYSLAIAAQLGGLDLAIDATDIDQSILDQAAHGEYPEDILDPMQESERAFFVIRDGRAAVTDAVKRSVQFLQASSFVTFTTTDRYDAILILNALGYVTPQQQSQAIYNAAQSSDVLCLTAFHPDSIRRDIAAAGLHPHDNNLREIHDGWADRRRNKARINRRNWGYSWKLPRFSTDEQDYAYRFCSIFTRAIR